MFDKKEILELATIKWLKDNWLQVLILLIMFLAVVSMVTDDSPLGSGCDLYEDCMNDGPPE